MKKYNKVWIIIFIIFVVLISLEIVFFYKQRIDLKEKWYCEEVINPLFYKNKTYTNKIINYCNKLINKNRYERNKERHENYLDSARRLQEKLNEN